MLHENNDKLNITKENVRKVEDIATEITQDETEREQDTLFKINNIIDQCDNFKCLNICVAEVPEDEGNFENIMVK